ncbi:glycine betaine/choline ABC-type transport system substrate-binding protein [Bradyrhizobium elkanii]
MRQWASGEVDVIAGYASEGRIKEYVLVTLADPKQAIPPYDAVVLLAPRRAHEAALQESLKPLLGRIDIATMREVRASGSNANSSPAVVARWLAEDR